MNLALQSTLFLLSDETLKAMLRDAERMLHDAPITAEETRYIIQRELNTRQA